MDFERVFLTHPSGASAQLTTYGAHVLSWRDSKGRERLFLSDRAVFTAGKAIRGGIPVIFPQFGPGPLPSHGFARNVLWSQHEARCTESSVELLLRHSAATRAVWPHDFEAAVVVSLAENSLTCSLRITNTDSQPFRFTAAFHTYFAVDSVLTTEVCGLHGCTYLDNLSGLTPRTEESARISFNGEIDRIYLTTPEQILIQERGVATAVVNKYSLPDAVVWNPWVEKSARLSDLGADDYLRFVCVEAGVIGTPVLLSPGEQWRGEQVLE